MMTELPPQEPATADYTQYLQEADALVRARRAPTPHAKARIKRELLARGDASRSTHTAQRFKYGALALAILLCIGGWWALRSSTDATTLEPTPEGISSADPRCLAAHTQALESIKLPPQCQLSWEAAAASITTYSDTILTLVQPETLELRRGEVTIKVTPRPKQRSSVRVNVSGGVIEVMGTTFTIQEDGERGQVALHEGKIRFTHTDGRRVVLLPGQSLSWPAQLAQAPVKPAPAPEPTTEQPTTPTPAPSNTIATSVATPKPKLNKPKRAPDAKALAQIAKWRRVGDYERALEALGALEGPDLDPRSAEIISYEIGDILTHQLKHSARACARWRKHLRTHRRGTYARAAKAAQRELECK